MVVRLFLSLPVFAGVAVVVWWFFDIVGLDEGTCGRRRPVRGSSGSGDRLISRLLVCPSYPLRLTSAGNRLPKFDYGGWRDFYPVPL